MRRSMAEKKKDADAVRPSRSTRILRSLYVEGKCNAEDWHPEGRHGEGDSNKRPSSESRASSDVQLCRRGSAREGRAIVQWIKPLVLAAGSRGRVLSLARQ